MKIYVRFTVAIYHDGYHDMSKWFNVVDVLNGQLVTSGIYQSPDTQTDVETVRQALEDMVNECKTRTGNVPKYEIDTCHQKALH